jgi:hypothetical protein
MFESSINNIRDEQNNVYPGINAVRMLFPFAPSLSPINAEIAALISLHEELLSTAQKVVTIFPQEKPSCD